VPTLATQKFVNFPLTPQKSQRSKDADRLKNDFAGITLQKNASIRDWGEGQ
jgi:hypothetical protein